MQTSTIISEDDFNQIYEPVPFGDNGDHVHPSVDGDDDYLWALPGRHTVHSVG